MDKVDSLLYKGKTILDSDSFGDFQVQVNGSGVVGSVKFRCEEHRFKTETDGATSLSNSFTPSTIDDVTKFDNFLENLDARGWRITRLTEDYSESDGAVIRPVIEKCTTKNCTPVIDLDITFDSSVEVVEAPWMTSGRLRKFSVVFVPPVNVVKERKRTPKEEPHCGFA